VVPSLEAGDVRNLMAALRVGRDEVLATLPVDRIVEAVDAVARRLMDAEDDLHREALEALGPWSGYSTPMAEAVLTGMARDWTGDRLEGLLRAEFPDPKVLETFRPGPEGGMIRAAGYPLTFHLGAGSVPGVGATSLIRSLLVRSAVLLKPGRGDVVLPVLLARGLMEVDPDVAGGVAVLYWPWEEEGRTREALDASEMVVVYGGDETVLRIRNQLPVTKPLRAYRHRMGVGLVGRRALGTGPGDVEPLAREVALSVALFDQRGCVSPHVVMVEMGGGVEPEAFADLVAQALEELEARLPSGPVTPGGGAELQQLRGEAEIQEALGRGFVRHGGEEGPWTVLFQPGQLVVPSCLNRTVRVIPVADLEDGLERLEDWEDHLQTVCVAGVEEDSHALEALVTMGVSRIVSFRGAPWPLPWWHHDGEGPLRSLVRWTDLERSLGS
jgi:hypothetical protein